MILILPKKLAGQKGYLLQYDRMNDEEKLEKYLEIEPELLIFDESKKNAEIEKLKKEKSELEKVKEDKEMLEDRVVRQEQATKHILEKLDKLEKK